MRDRSCAGRVFEALEPSVTRVVAAQAVAVDQPGVAARIGVQTRFGRHAVVGHNRPVAAREESDAHPRGDPEIVAVGLVDAVDHIVVEGL